MFGLKPEGSVQRRGYEAKGGPLFGWNRQETGHFRDAYFQKHPARNLKHWLKKTRKDQTQNTGVQTSVVVNQLPVFTQSPFNTIQKELPSNKNTHFHMEATDSCLVLIFCQSLSLLKDTYVKNYVPLHFQGDLGYLQADSCRVGSTLGAS